jgi:hypothetical protein
MKTSHAGCPVILPAIQSPTTHTQLRPHPEPPPDPAPKSSPDSARRLRQPAGWPGVVGLLLVALMLGSGTANHAAELVAHWPMDGDGTNLVAPWDTGALEGEVLTVPGRIDQALQFDGDPNSHMWVWPSDTFALTTFTLAAWIHIPGPFTAGWQTILEHNRNGPNWYGLWRSGSANATNRLHFRWGAAGAADFIGTIAPGQWHHVAGTYGDGVATFYLNGELDRIVDPAAAPSLAPVNTELRIGANLAGGEGFPGIIDDVRIYNGVLSHEEIIELALVTPAPIEIIQQPLSVTAMVGDAATLSVAVTGTIPRYQWYKDPVTPGDPAAAIAEATSATLVFDPVQATDAGNYQVIITNAISAQTSAVATLTVTADVVPPDIASILALGDLSRVIVVFDEPVNPGTAENPGHYGIDTGTAVIDVLAASLDPDGRSVLLTTAPMQSNTQYTLLVSGVADLAEPPNTANTSRTFLTPDVLGNWQFNEPSGSTVAADSSGKGHDGQLVDFSMGGFTGTGEVTFVDSTQNRNRIVTQMPLYAMTNAPMFMVDVTFTYTGPANRAWTPVLGSSWGPNYNASEIFYIGKQNNVAQLNLNIAGVHQGAIPNSAFLFDGNQHNLVLIYNQATDQISLYADGSATPFFSTTANQPQNRLVISTSTLWIGATGHGYTATTPEIFVGNIDRAIFAVQLPTQPQPEFLPPALSEAGLELTWTGSGVLEWSLTVDGPWDEIMPQPTGNEHTAEIVPGENRFFRLRGLTP